MDKQEEEKYNHLLEMFNSKGWEEFNKDLGATLDQLVKYAPDQCQTNEDWQFRRGAIAQIKQISGYENFIRVSLAQAEEEDATL